MKKAELLAPSGNFECVRAAVANGADAVYLGGQLFNARAYAANFSNEELAKVCDFCHGYDVKVYVTVNTLYKDEEFKELMDFINELYCMGVDGLIMQDLGAIDLVRKMWPDFPVHVSTQLTSNSLEDIRAYEKLGVKTAVLSRELNLEEIKHICENTEMRIETFIHGALCVSYSGQCLMSSVLGNRSGNRGKCAQNCRLPYELYEENKKVNEGRLLSTKDICTLDLLPELLETGVASLKVEGRMKSPEYVAGVTAIYRKYLDLYYSNPENYHVEEADRDILKQLFNRGGFSEGYLKTHSGVVMMCKKHPKSWGVPAGEVIRYDYKKQLATIRFRKNLFPGDGIEIWSDDEEGTGTYINKQISANSTETLKIKGKINPKQPVYQTFDKKLNEYLDSTFATVRRKRKITGFVKLLKGHDAELVFRCDGVEVKVTGQSVAEALNQPLSENSVREQISKIGNSIFELTELKVVMGDDVYLNKSALNALKNEACEQLQKKIENSYHRVSRRHELSEHEYRECSEKKLNVSVSDQAQFDVVCGNENVDTTYCLYNDELMRHLDEFINKAHENGRKLFVRLPRIFRQYVIDKCKEDIERLNKSDIDGYLITNVGHYNYLMNSGKALRLDYTGNVINNYSYDYWQDKVDCITMSIEASVEQINSVSGSCNKEIIAYSLLPLMVTNQCPIGNYAGHKLDSMYCEKYGHKNQYYLKNGSNSFPLITDCKNCVCQIYSSDKLDVSDRINEFNVDNIRIDFINEKTDEVRKVMERFARALKGTSVKSDSELNIYYRTLL
ncbi:MAG: U32 family peptidase [Erysipelotrichaceae bacterium]|nr:U32 family peptidase [Erysipelotrichaceae bacterium]